MGIRAVAERIHELSARREELLKSLDEELGALNHEMSYKLYAQWRMFVISIVDLAACFPDAADPHLRAINSAKHRLTLQRRIAEMQNDLETMITATTDYRLGSAARKLGAILQGQLEAYLHQLAQDEDDEDVLPSGNVREDLRRILKELHFSLLPSLCAEILVREGHSGVEIARGGPDGGLDIRSVRNGERWGTQCKCHATRVGRPVLDALHGRLMAEDRKRGLLITTNRFSKALLSAVEEMRAKALNGDGSIEIQIVDGDSLIDKLIQYQVGVNEFGRLDLDFWKKLGAR